MTIATLQDALVDGMRDMLSAERQVIRALPRLIRQAGSRDLRDALSEHLKETEEQISRLEEAFNLLEVPVRAKRCRAMEGLIEEGEEILEEEPTPEVADAMIIGASQKVEHYEIAAYGSLSAWAELLDRPDVQELIEANLDEEKAANLKLSAIAEGSVNALALQAAPIGDAEDDEEQDTEEEH